jgi:hypothetical protein
MATLAADAPVVEKKGDLNSIGIIASDIVYEGAMVGDNAAGYGRPLVAGDKFLGHAVEKVDNSSGSAGDKNITLRSGRYRLKVALVGTITDVGQPVYASDDAVLTFAAPSNSFVGVVTRYVSATHLEVEFRPGQYDEFGPNEARETKSDNYTVDALDGGKIIYVDTDAKTITLPATDVGIQLTLVNAGSFGTVALTISPNANDKIQGNDVTAADNKNYVNTKATAKRGDFVTLLADGTDGWFILAQRGTWAREA